MKTLFFFVKDFKNSKAVLRWEERFLSFILAALLLLPALMFAEEGYRTIETRKISGIVGAVRSDYVSVMYDEDSLKGLQNEIGFYREDGLELKNKRSWEDIEIGDRVLARYEEELESHETSGEEAGGQKSAIVISRKLQALVFEENQNSPLAS